MPGQQKLADKGADSLKADLLALRDELSALNACTAFVLESLSDALSDREGSGGRSATGAALCVEWLGDRAIELERRLKSIHERAS